MTFAERLKAVRLDSDASQETFARKIGVPARTYQNIESGKTDRVPVSCLEKLQDDGVDIIWLITGNRSGNSQDVSIPSWLSPTIPLLKELDESGRSELTGWVKGYLSAQPQKKTAGTKGRKAS